MKIKKIRLENFIGLDKISKDNVVEIDFHKQDEFVLLYGENGLGKTTILESLTPYSDMISRNIKDSIRYPARKTVEFTNNNDIIKVDILWESKEHTKGHIYINDIMTDETRKGNITEFRVQVEKLFGEYEKFKSSLFLKQGVQDIIQAKPKERMNIINSFLGDLSMYDDIKEKSVEMENTHKTKIKMYKDQLSEMYTWEEEYKKYEERVEKFKKIEIEELKKEFIEKEIIKTKEEKKKLQIDNLKLELEELINKGMLDLNKKEEIKKELEGLRESIIKKQSEYSIEEINKVLEDISLKNKELDLVSQKDIVNISNEAEKYLKLSKEEIEKIIEKNKRNNQFLSQIQELENQIKEINVKTELSIEELEEEKEKKEKITQRFKTFNISKEVEKYKSYSIEELEINIEKNKRNNQLLSQIQELEKKIKDKTLKTELSIEELEEEKETKEKIIELKEEIKEINLKELESIKELRILKEEISLLLNIEGKEICHTCGHELSKEKTKEKIIELKEEIRKIEKEYGEKNLKEIILYIERKEEEKIKNQYLKKELKKLEEKRKTVEEITVETLKEEIELKRLLLTTNERIEELKPKIEKVICNDNKVLEDTIFIKYLIDNDIKYKLGEKIEFLFDTQLKIKELKEEIENKRTRSNLKNQKLNLNEKITQTICSNNELLLEVLHLRMLKDNKILFSLKEGSYIFELNKEERIKELEELKKKKEKLFKLEEEVKKEKEKILDNEKELLNIEHSIERKEKIEEKIITINFNEELFENINIEFIEIKRKFEEVQKEEQYLENQKLHYEREVKRYQSIIEEKNKEEEQYFVYNKLKNYSGRIKTALVSNFFANITETVNQLIKNDNGSLKNLKINIEQPSATKFNIIATNGLNEVKDISLLSGAEQSIVARGISLALAKKYNFGILWLDETDSALSTTNKNSFIKTLDKAKNIINIEQFFLVSHNDNLRQEVDNVINLNEMMCN